MAYRIKTRKGLLTVYNSRSLEVRDYFEHLPRLIDEFPLEVALTYVSTRLERGKNLTLYCGLVKLHNANAKLTREMIDTQDLTRQRFVKFYRTVYDFDLPKDAASALATALQVRADFLRGRQLEDDHLRNAIARMIECADAINTQLSDKHVLRPFGDLRGLSGRTRKLDPKKTRAVFKKMGFTIT